MELIPVGVIHNPISLPKNMPALGLDGVIEVFPEYTEALEGIEDHSHLIVIGWLHKTIRSVCKVVPRKISSDLPEKGVFAIRSPARPNPLSITVVKLGRVRDDRFLEVSFLDLINGTLVIDLKPYQPGTDCVFSATSRGSSKILRSSSELYRDDLIREAINFHGEYCPGAAVAVRMVIAASHLIGRDFREAEISCRFGQNPCINDALMGMTGARFGNGRLKISPNTTYTITALKATLEFSRISIPQTIQLVNSVSDRELFLLEVNIK